MDNTNQLNNSKKERILFYVAIFLAICNGILVWTNIRLADNASDTLNQSKENARTELRAYIQVVNAKATQMKIEKTLEITITYKNTGKTPAYNVRIQAAIMPGGKGIDENTWSKLYKIEKQGSNVLGSDFPIEFPITSGWLIKDSTTIPAWKSGGKYLGVYGIIYYDDAFGYAHWNRFYLRYYWLEDKFVFDPNYNDADKYGVSK